MSSSKLKQLKDLCKPEQSERSNKYVTHPVVRFIPTVGLEAGEAEEFINLDLQLSAEDTPRQRSDLRKQRKLQREKIQRIEQLQTEV